MFEKHAVIICIFLIHKMVHHLWPSTPKLLYGNVYNSRRHGLIDYVMHWQGKESLEIIIILFFVNRFGVAVLSLCSSSLLLFNN